MEKYFSREFEVLSKNVNLEFLQHTVGDVGCVVWDAALVLAGFLDQLNYLDQHSFKGLKILELGSGTGCVGLVAAALGGDCLLTDLPEMVPLMKRNISRNSLALEGTASAKAFDWGSDICELVPESNQGYNIVLAADCLYYRESLDAFIKTIKELSAQSCNGKKTEIYVSYEERESEEKKNLIHDFMENIKSSCSVTKISYDDYREDFRCEDIQILKIVSH